MAKKAGDYDFSDVWSVGTTAAHPHHSEEERLRDEFFFQKLKWKMERKWFMGL